MRRHRIFAVIASSDAGGAEETFATLLRHLDRRRFEVFVACHGRGLFFEEYERHASRIWALDLRRVIDLRTVARLARLMRDTRCDLVHTYLWSADLIGGLAARLAGIRATVATVTSEYFLTLGAPSRLVALRRRLLSRTYRSTYRLASRVVTMSRFLASDLSDRPGLRVPARKIEVIYNPLDEARLAGALAAAPALVRATGSPVVVTVANFHPVKGHEALVRAMPAVVARHPDARFVLVGDGPTRPAIELLVRSLGLAPHVVFTGQLLNGAAAMRGADLLVLPSLSEGLGVVLLEAFALGTPVVASRTGGIPEVLGENEAGLLVPPGDPGALAGAMLRALDDPAATAARVARGRQRLAERFSVEQFVERTERLYLDLLAARDAPAD